MKNSTVKLLACWLGLASLFTPDAHAADVSHFRAIEIPSNESRLSELARVREFRCSFELAEKGHSALLIAEFYRDGKRISAFPLSLVVNGNPDGRDKGVVSIGWHRDLHRLTSVVFNEYPRYSPWTASVEVKGFKPFDAFYFENSMPEAREPERERGMAFKLYPVLGLCGDRKGQIAYSSVKDAKSFLDACQRANAKEALIIYVYVTQFDEHPSIKFDKQGE